MKHQISVIQLEPQCSALIKPFTDEQVFYDKFLCDKFYLPSVRVYAQHFLYDKFLCDKFSQLKHASFSASALVIEKIGKMGRTDEQSKLVT
jgi:hypothetical protein